VNYNSESVVLVVPLRSKKVAEDGIACKKCSIIERSVLIETMSRFKSVEVCYHCGVVENFCVGLDNVWDWITDVGRANARCCKSRKPQISTIDGRPDREQTRTLENHSGTTVYIAKIGIQDGS
jgi:hypothetical protein